MCCSVCCVCWQLLILLWLFGASCIVLLEVSVCCSVLVICYLLFVACCSLSDGCRVLHVVCHVLCLLFAV